jgi:hypothetical protein
LQPNSQLWHIQYLSPFITNFSLIYYFYVGYTSSEGDNSQKRIFFAKLAQNTLLLNTRCHIICVTSVFFVPYNILFKKRLKIILHFTPIYKKKSFILCEEAIIKVRQHYTHRILQLFFQYWESSSGYNMSINCNLLQRRNEPSTNAREVLKIYNIVEMHVIFSFLYSKDPGTQHSRLC